MAEEVMVPLSWFLAAIKNGLAEIERRRPEGGWHLLKPRDRYFVWGQSYALKDLAEFVTRQLQSPPIKRRIVVKRRST